MVGRWFHFSNFSLEGTQLNTSRSRSWLPNIGKSLLPTRDGKRYRSHDTKTHTEVQHSQMRTLVTNIPNQITSLGQMKIFQFCAKIQQKYI